MKPPKQSYDFRIETPNYFTAFPHDRIRVGGSENRTGYTISRFACTLNASGVASSAARIFDATPPAAQLKAGAIKNCPVQNCWLCRAANRKTESCHLRPARAFSATGPAAEDDRSYYKINPKTPLLAGRAAASPSRGSLYLPRRPRLVLHRTATLLLPDTVKNHSPLTSKKQTAAFRQPSANRGSKGLFGLFADISQDTAVDVEHVAVD